MIWDLDDKSTNAHTVSQYMKQHGLDKGTHPRLSVGDVIEFNTGYDNDIRARATIKGIQGENLYVYTDCYWFPIRDDDSRKIIKCEAA